MSNRTNNIEEAAAPDVGCAQARILRCVPNALSLTRVPMSVSLLIVKPFSAAFFFLYLLCGLTDLLDGRLARRFRVESSVGAKLDGIADFTFFGCSFYVILTTLSIPEFLLVWVALIVVIRAVSLAVATRKFHSWAALHTQANKLTFVMYYLFPLCSWMFGVALAGTVLCAITTYAFLEEAYINTHTESLDLDIPNVRALR